MRRSIILAAGTLAVAGLALVAARTETRPRTVAVHVHVRCGPGPMQSSVNPWRAAVDQGDDVRWILDSSATVVSLEIEPKTGAWPFETRRPRGSPAAPARSGRMKPEQPAGRYPYKITAICEPVAGESDTIVIDPDIVIR